MAAGGARTEVTVSAAGSPVARLVEAAELGRARIVEQMLSSIPFDGEARKLAFDRAVCSGSADTVRFFHQGGVPVDGTAMRRAARRGAVEVIRYLHQNGVPIDVVERAELLSIAAGGHVEALVYLHQNGLDLRARLEHPSGEAIVIADEMMRAAVAAGSFAVCHYLVQNVGVELSRLGPSIYQAAVAGHLEVLRLLERFGLRFDGHLASGLVRCKLHPRVRDYFQDRISVPAGPPLPAP
jgi:hypothetical protein